MRDCDQPDKVILKNISSLSKGRRERELLRITRENMNMLHRIAYKKPAISRAQHEEDWKENLHFMSNISSFPEDWYLRDKKSSRPEENKAKSQAAE